MQETQDFKKEKTVCTLAAFYYILTKIKFQHNFYGHSFCKIIKFNYNFLITCFLKKICVCKPFISDIFSLILFCKVYRLIKN